MRSTLSQTFLAAAALACFATAGHTATLGLAAGPAVLSGTGDAFYAPGSDLTFAGGTDAGADIAIAVALDSSGELSAGVDPGALLVDGVISGSVDAFGFTIDPGTDGGDRIEIGFTPGDGPLVADLGSRGLAILTGEFGTADDFAASSFFSASSIAISPVIETAPIPLPASGLLLVAGIALLGLRRRKPA